MAQKLDPESGTFSQLEQFIIDTYTTTCNMVGWTYLLIGEYAKSEQVFMEMFKYPTALKATAQASAAYAQCYQGKMVEALENVHASLKLIEVGGLSWNRVWALVTLGYVEWQIGDYRAAIVRLENLIDDYGAEDAFRRPLTAARTYLAEALLANGQIDQAMIWTEQTLELMNTEMWEEMYYESMIIKACIALERGDDEGAGARFQRALRGAYDIENHFLFCRALIGLYDIMRRRQTPDAAILGVFLQERGHEVTMRDKQWLHRLSQAWPEFRDPVVRPVNSAAEVVRLIELSGLVEEDSPVQMNVTVDKSR